MNVLAIESSGVIGSVAACNDSGAIAEQSLEAGMEHGRMLVALVDQVVSAAGWDKKRDIQLVCVSSGPGSFTGLRVGVTCAKMIASLLGVPLVGVGSFDALVENAPRDAEKVLTVLDAKRGQVFAAGYRKEAGKFMRLFDPATMAPAQAADGMSGGAVHVMGDGADRFRDVFHSAGFHVTHSDLWRIRASTVARLGLERFTAGSADNPSNFEPIYLRLAEAEEKRQMQERKLL